MSHHINSEGKFQSDKYPDLAPDKIVISFKDSRAHKGLRQIAKDYADSDLELTEDIISRLDEIESTKRNKQVLCQLNQTKLSKYNR